MAGIEVIIVDPEQSIRKARLDSITHCISTLDYTHHERHDGNYYMFLYSAIINNAGTIEMRIQTPNTTKWGHYEIIVEGSLAGKVEMWSATTKTDVSGNRITGFNVNQNSSNVSGMTVCHTPAGSQSGAANLGPLYYGASASGGRVAVGGGTTSRGEFILKQNTAYLVRNTSLADGNSLTIRIEGYEHTSKQNG